MNSRRSEETRLALAAAYGRADTVDVYTHTAEIIRLKARVAELEKLTGMNSWIIVQLELSLKAIGYPQPHDAPDGRVCGVMARGALLRAENKRKEPQ